MNNHFLPLVISMQHVQISYSLFDTASCIDLLIYALIFSSIQLNTHVRNRSSKHLIII